MAEKVLSESDSVFCANPCCALHVRPGTRMFGGTEIRRTWEMASLLVVDELPMSCCASNARRRSIEGNRASKSDKAGTNEAGRRHVRVAMTSFVMNRLNSRMDLESRTVTLS